MRVQQLWLQDAVARKWIKVEKVAGTENIADALTKVVEPKEIQKHCDKVNMDMRKGRHDIAPEITEQTEEQ